MSQEKLAETAEPTTRQVRAEAQITDLRTEKNPEGRREHPRFGVELDVSLGSDHNFYAGFAENLSAGGLFVATHMLKPVGEIIELCIHFPDDDKMLKGTGEVRWIREYNESSDVPPGMGVKFLELEEGSLETIEYFLAKREPLFFDDD